MEVHATVWDYVVYGCAALIALIILVETDS